MLKNKAYEEEVKAITQKQMVFIFDECHRSQFGDLHKKHLRFLAADLLHFGFSLLHRHKM